MERPLRPNITLSNGREFEHSPMANGSQEVAAVDGEPMSLTEWSEYCGLLTLANKMLSELEPTEHDECFDYLVDVLSGKTTAYPADCNTTFDPAATALLADDNPRSEAPHPDEPAQEFSDTPRGRDALDRRRLNRDRRKPEHGQA